ncbi:MAG: hypothetical protein J0L70_23140 [Leptolyngbya sp. UWPOB_LEPTO1]|uniref:hypothetical protein n=1 Tax=Leptolyngbya sp. UWPOB_LEPTO1 TaxID=2815653 RepID=UPI001AD55BDA|nr:hypothetical protein [Leptolyngbya sp. UWPOB_LEPTO1]MBN8563436.1 hypothetical protein [Leptolyngbya sp. UWPOB_LEPTO1]
MSNYHRDDGSMMSGIFVFGCVLLSFVAGYWVRDQGVLFKVEVPQTEQRRAK